MQTCVLVVLHNPELEQGLMGHFYLPTQLKEEGTQNDSYYNYQKMLAFLQAPTASGQESHAWPNVFLSGAANLQESNHPAEDVLNEMLEMERITVAEDLRAFVPGTITEAWSPPDTEISKVTFDPRSAEIDISRQALQIPPES